MNTKTVPFEALRMKLKAEDYSLRFVHNKEDQKRYRNKKRRIIPSLQVGVTGLEPATAWSQTRNATNCATPRCKLLFPDNLSFVSRLRMQRYELYFNLQNFSLFFFKSSAFYAFYDLLITLQPAIHMFFHRFFIELYDFQ